MRTYLLDTNSFVTPYNSYYSFNFTKNFWAMLKDFIQRKVAVIIKPVYDEIMRHSEDALIKWIKNFNNSGLIQRMNVNEIMSNYGKILRYIQESDYYTEAALAKWSEINVADPWLIATAMHFNYVIVTLEQPVGQLLKNQPTKNPKIPNVAEHFNVKWIPLFEFMRETNIKL